MIVLREFTIKTIKFVCRWSRNDWNLMAVTKGPQINEL